MALALGRADINTLEEELTAEEFFEWVEYWKQEPFGLEWYRAALVAYTQASSMTKIDQSFIDKFQPNYDPNPRQSEEEMAAEFEKLRQIQKARKEKS